MYVCLCVWVCVCMSVEGLLFKYLRSRLECMFLNSSCNKGECKSNSSLHFPLQSLLLSPTQELRTWVGTIKYIPQPFWLLCYIITMKLQRWQFSVSHLYQREGHNLAKLNAPFAKPDTLGFNINEYRANPLINM